MYQVSEMLDKVISGSGRTFFARLNDVQNGIQKITQTDMSTPDSHFYVGGAIASKIEVSMYTKSTDFTEGTEVKFEIGAFADEEIEWIPMGYFTIKDASKDRDLLTFTAYDRIGTKLTSIYESKVASYPAESKEFLKDISAQTGIEFDMSELTEAFMIDKILSVDDQSGEKTYKNPFDGFTLQQVVGYIAQLYGKFAVCDRSGVVVFRWYKKVNIPSDGNRILDQYEFPIKDQTGSALYDSRIDYGDGGKIGDSKGGFLKDQESFFILDTLKYYASAQTYIIKTNRYFDDLLKSETLCTISGIKCKTESNYYESGGIINLNLSNSVMTQQWLDNIWGKVKDMSFFPVSFSFMGDPRLDLGDIIVIIDHRGNPIDVPVMEHVLKFDGGLLSEVASYGIESIAVQGPTQLALQRVRDDILVLQEITAEKATFNQLSAVDAKITNLQASVITADTANILYARLDKTNIELGWITTAMIGDAQITDAKIKSLAASKLTAGTIDASDINVINLNAANITVGKINGKQLSNEVNSDIKNSLNTANSALSTANSSIQTVKIEYYSSLSETELLDGVWSEATPTWTEGKYIWSRTKTTTKSGTTTYSNAVCITGNTGAKGEQGLRGPQGERGEQGIQGLDGKTTYFHIKYSAVSNPTSSSQITETPSTYIGTYVDFTELDSTDPKKYIWSRFEGIQGSKGDQGIPGTNGENGQTSYLHIAYANSADGKNDFSVSNSDNKQYIGQYTDFTKQDSTDPAKYAWSKIKGDTGAQGKGIRSIKDQYYLSNSSSSPIGGMWSDTQPDWIEGFYIWTRSYIVWSDDTITATTPVLANALNTANSLANTALSTADGKNTVFYQSTQPTTAGRSTNDIWYDTGNGNAMYYFDGKSWVKKVFGNNALDNISASKITTGTLDAEKVTLINLDAGSIKTGTITGIDAIFNRSFAVNSPYSDTERFIIEASSNGVTIATRTDGVVASTNDNYLFLGNDGLDIRCGTGPMRIWGNDVLTVRTDSEGLINLEVQGLNSADTPIYVKSDAGSFRIFHEGNLSASASYDSGLKIGSVTKRKTAIDFFVPLATNTTAGLISADEKKKINTDYLPKSGGIVSSENIDVLGVNSTSGIASTIKFYGNGTELGSIGFNERNSKLYRWSTSGTACRILDEDDLPLLSDSGWVDVSLENGISAIGYIGARVRRIGNMVNLVMGITGATAAFQTLGTLAASYRPPKEISFAARYVNSPSACVAIETDGAIKLLANASGGTTYTSSSSITFSVTYFV